MNTPRQSLVEEIASLIPKATKKLTEGGYYYVTFVTWNEKAYIAWKLTEGAPPARSKHGALDPDVDVAGDLFLLPTTPDPDSPSFTILRLVAFPEGGEAEYEIYDLTREFTPQKLEDLRNILFRFANYELELPLPPHS